MLFMLRRFRIKCGMTVSIFVALSVIPHSDAGSLSYVVIYQERNYCPFETLLPVLNVIQYQAQGNCLCYYQLSDFRFYIRYQDNF